MDYDCILIVYLCLIRNNVIRKFFLTLYVLKRFVRETSELRSLLPYCMKFVGYIFPPLYSSFDAMK